MARNQSVPKRDAERIILFYAPNIESDIDSLLGDEIASQAEYTATAVRIAKFLNATLCNGGVVPPPNPMPPKDTPLVCHHTQDEWVFTPCPSCPKDQREAINREQV
jgi:hypothetical protein